MKYFPTTGLRQWMDYSVLVDYKHVFISGLALVVLLFCNLLCLVSFRASLRIRLLGILYMIQLSGLG